MSIFSNKASFVLAAAIVGAVSACELRRVGDATQEALHRLQSEYLDSRP